MPYTKIAAFLGAIAVVIAGLFGIAYIAHDTRTAEQAAADLYQGGTIINGSGYTIEEVPTLDIPDYRRPIAFSDSVPADVRAILSARAAVAAETLAKDQTNPSAWYELALLYKSGNDYEGARIIWEFLTRAAPQDPIAFDNLGRMYHFDLKEYAKAEEYFKKSLALRDTVTTPYLQLFELYRYSYKTDTTAAVDIMRDAMAQFPNDPGLPHLLGIYYRDLGRMSEARSELERAVQIARAAGNVMLVSQLTAELSRL